MNLAVRIQAHPSRAELLPRLLDGLAGFSDVEVVLDPGADQKPDHWRSHRACLEAMPADASHLCVLQDDALLRPSFSERLAAAIEARPESLLLAFVPGFPRERRVMALAHRSKQAFAPFLVGAFVPTVAIVYPREVVKGLLAWADTKGGDRYRRPLAGADDGIVAYYCRARRIHPVALVPSIVEHDESVPSIGKKTRSGLHRRAALL